MALRTWLTPRDVVGASRALFVLSLVSLGVLIVADVLSPAGGLSLLGLVTAALVPLASWLLRRVPDPTSICWRAVAPVGIGLVALLAATAPGDCRVGLLFLFFPAMYAARQLPRNGAFLVIGSSAAVALAVSLATEPLRQGLLDTLFLDAVLITTMSRLAVSGDRIAGLLSQLEQQAAVDPLTGLVTRRRLDEAIEAALASPCERGTALILLDLDNFKTINDRWGHPAGDAVLVQIAQILKRHSRPGDVLGRLGGDEIAVLMNDIPLETAVGRAEQIRATIAAHLFTLPDADPVDVSVSAGVAHAPTHASELRGLYADADRALYLAKHSGRNRVSAQFG